MKQEATQILLSLIATIVLLVLGCVAAEYINTNYSLTIGQITYVRIGSASLIAWAVFGRLYNFESWEGKTFAEKFKKAWFVVTYSTGFFGAIISMQLVAYDQA